MNNNLNRLIDCLIEGDQKAAVDETKSLLESGTPVEIVISHGVEQAMSQLDNKCTVEQFNLLEIMLSGRAVMGVMNVLYPPNQARVYTKGKVVLATLEGAVHDLGKNILRMILQTNGYEVIDCGKDCPVDKLVNTVKDEKPIAVGVSGLITTVIPKIVTVKSRLMEIGLDEVKVMAGGAALKQSTAERLNLDFLAQTAFDSLNYLSGFSRRLKDSN